MMFALLVAGIAAFLAGLVAILFGISVKEFSFGSTLIVAGAVGVCTGLILLGLCAVVRELKVIALRLGAGASAEVQGRPMFRQPAAASGGAAAAAGGFLFNRDQPVPPTAAEAGADELAAPAQPSSRPRFAESAGRERAPPPPQAGTESLAGQTPQPRRSVMFSSNLRRERERAARAAEQTAPTDDRFAPPSPSGVSESTEPRPASFDTVWTQPERTRSGEGAPRRLGRPSYAAGEPSTPAPEQAPEPPPSAEQPAVTVLKSGVVDGMAYSLYSDGSIEAQMPEGMMRFASIDELRAHLDLRS